MNKQERIDKLESYYRLADELFHKLINAPFPSPGDLKRLAALQMAISRELINVVREI